MGVEVRARATGGAIDAAEDGLPGIGEPTSAGGPFGLLESSPRKACEAGNPKASVGASFRFGFIHTNRGVFGGLSRVTDPSSPLSLRPQA